MNRLLTILLAVLATGICQAQQADSLITLLNRSADKAEQARLSLAISDKLSRVNPQAALEYAVRSIELAQELGLDSLMNWARMSQATTYMQLGNYPQSLQIYHQVARTAERDADSALLSVVYGNQGSIYYYQRDLDEALFNYLKSLGMMGRSDRTRSDREQLRRANLYNNIGIIYDETEKFDSAGSYYNEALRLAERLDYAHEARANILNNIGTLNVDQGNFDEAYSYYVQAMELRRANNNHFGLARSYNNLGEYFVRHKFDAVKAEKYLQDAVALSEEIGSLQTLNSASQLLYELYATVGNYEKALHALEQKMNTSDSLFNEENTRKITQLEMQFEFDKKQREAELLQKQRELYFLLGVTLLGLLLLGVTILWLLQKNKTRKAQIKEVNLKIDKIKLQNDLAIKDKELATNIMYLLNKNELINSISEKLLEIKQNPSPTRQPLFKKWCSTSNPIYNPSCGRNSSFASSKCMKTFTGRSTKNSPNSHPVSGGCVLS
ncbi:MAG: tetratricopeptide repeat protein [Bacteroidia bacterium]|nr:tetratricopeptide repeat protein [Bacteroidia bacterium]